METLFTSSRILIDNENNKKLIAGGILVSNEDGTILKILDSQSEINTWLYKEHACEAYDYGDKIIMPGLVDVNVNVCSGRDDWEDFNSLTKAAAAGGVTTIVDNPSHSLPPTTNVENLRQKMMQARNNIFVDVAFWAGITNSNQKDLIELANNGVVGFKCYLSPTDIDEFPHLSKENLMKSMEILEETDLVLAINPELIEVAPKEDANPKNYESYLSTKPVSTETSAVELITNLAKNHNLKIHLPNISSAEVAPIIRNYRNNNKGKTISMETCHHYLSIVSDEIANGKTEYKTSPPIRNHSNRSKLWEAVKTFEIDLISSHHTPSNLGQKCMIHGKNRGNFLEAMNGVSSLQFGLPVFWSNCEIYGLTYFDVNRYLSLNPSKLLNLDKNKGKIEVGYDADFCIWDPDEQFTVLKDDIFYKNKICPYIGKTLRGKVQATVVRGYIVYDANDPTFDAPIGNILLKRSVKKTNRSIRSTNGSQGDGSELNPSHDVMQIVNY